MRCAARLQHTPGGRHSLDSSKEVAKTSVSGAALRSAPHSARFRRRQLARGLNREPLGRASNGNAVFKTLGDEHRSEDRGRDHAPSRDRGRERCANRRREVVSRRSAAHLHRVEQYTVLRAKPDCECTELIVRRAAVDATTGPAYAVHSAPAEGRGCCQTIARRRLGLLQDARERQPHGSLGDGSLV